MAEKKAKPAPKAVAKKAVEKKASPAPKVAAKKKVSSGDAYSCEVCGLVVSVDEECGCVSVCDIICCGEPMKTQPVKVRASKK